MCSIILAQNYFQDGGWLHLQPEGLALRAPIYSIFSEIYLEYL
jgi:hypothetical protein